MLVSCNFASETPSPTPIPTFTPTLIPSSPANDAITTLNSLELIDEHPLYVMHYIGEYAQNQSFPDSPAFSGFSCSLYAALGDPDNLLYGRNFDWASFSPALLLFTDPPEGYASVSMVDIAFLGYDAANAYNLTDLSFQERAALLAAPFLPFDGMNEHGLTVGMAAVTASIASYDPTRPTIGSLAVIREALDHAQTVDEAIAIFEQNNIDFTGGPPIHYLVADATGHAILIEYIQGEMIVLPNEKPWHLATNFLCGATEGNGGCTRYATLESRLTETAGGIDAGGAMHLLELVSQPGLTQWSIVYHPSTGNVDIVMGEHYETVYQFKIPAKYP